MKSLSIIALVAAVSLCFAGNVTKTLTYSSGALKLGTENGYTTVDFAGLPHLDKLGAPDLPVVPCQFVIPATAEVTSFEITGLREEPVAGTYTVIPVQHPEPYMDNPPQFPFVQPNPAYYAPDAQFPAQAAEFVDVGIKAGYRLASFRVYPVRFNPAARRLSVVTRLTVRVNYAEGKAHAARHSDLQIALHGAEVSHLVLNPQDVARCAPPKKTRGYGSAFLPAGTYEHVILTTHQYVDSLIPLRDWRTRQGWRSKIVEIDSIAAVFPGVDTAEKMRNFLKDAETTWSTIFCFIARKDAPARQYRNAYGYVSGYPVDYFPSDWYFGCLDGSWNADGDGYWGEPNDSVDCWTDIHVGMITLDGFPELSKYLSKVFRYEFTPDTGWFCKALLGNDVTFSNEYNDSIANATPTPPWFDLKMYTTGGMVTPTVQRYCDSLNSGYPLTAVIAHGDVDLYGMGGNVTSPIMNALTNTNRLSMLTGVCCHTGAWDEAGNTNGDCVAENMAFHAPNGFIGVDMNSRYGWVAVAEFFNYSISYGLVGFRTARRITQGEALSYGKDYWHALVAVTTDTSKFRWEAYERNLFGEPAVPIWTGRAFTASVTHPGAINIGSGIPVNVTVNDSKDAPVESAMVCLNKTDETFARGFTDGSGQVTLLVSPLTPGRMQLTVTGANNYPVLDSIVVMASGKFVSYLRHTVSDPQPGGNGDGIINPGESFRLPMWVKNYGTQTANSVTGRLITHTQGALITDSVKSFGNVAGGDSAENAQGFGMSVATGLPNGYAIPCSLVCKDDLDSTWVSYVTLRVGAPVISFVSKEVRDSMGNNNGKLDPDETADLVVTIRNGGIGNAYNVHTVLRSGDSRMTVPDSMADYGTLLHDSSATNYSDHFTLHADAAIPRETPVPCTLDVYADAGYVGHEAFVLVVGEVRAIDPIPDGPRTPALYWAYDNEDAGYSEHPEYNWIEIDNVGTRLTLSDDQTVVVSLPTGFGPLRYYGQNYTQVAICGNGWVAPGTSSSSAYSNTALPATTIGAPAVFINWDDLYPPTGNGVWYFHDTLNHCFVVEWDSVAYYSQRSTFDKYEVVIYDTSEAAEDGNSEIVFQYKTANQTNSATVGEQDPTIAIAIQCLLDGTYTRGASPWVAGHAVKFTTDPPVPTGVTEPNVGMKALNRRPLGVFPNPFRSSALVNWQVKVDGVADLKVFDASGRAVRTLASGSVRAGSYMTAWNGTDNAGRKLAHGIYFVRLVTQDQTLKVKAVLTR